MGTRIICIAQMKGGTGKTLTTAALGRCLASRGKHVLLIDTDPQMNLSFINGVNVTDLPPTLYDVWTGQATIQEAIQPVVLPTLDIITGGLKLASADMQFSGKFGREHLMKEAIQPIQSNYDYILIDTPPTLGLLTMTAATAATSVIIPMTTDVLSVQGLGQLWGFIRNIRSYCNTVLHVEGILLTMYDSRTLTTKGLGHQIIEAAKAAGTKVYNTRIRYTQAIRTAQARRDTSIYDKASINAIRDYMDFTDEVIKEGEADER